MRRPRGRSGGHGQHHGGGGGGGQHHNPNRPPNRNQSYDSNGPDVRVRGTAYQIFEKYQGLAREATSSGDRILAEAYYQYAEHYFRIIQQLGGYVPRYNNGQDEGAGDPQNPDQQQGAPQAGGEGGAPVPPQGAAPGEGGPQQGGHPGQFEQGPPQHPQQQHREPRGQGGYNGDRRQHYNQGGPHQDRNGGEGRSAYGEAQMRRPERGPRGNDPAQADQPDIGFATYDREPV